MYEVTIYNIVLNRGIFELYCILQQVLSHIYMHDVHRERVAREKE